MMDSITLQQELVREIGRYSLIQNLDYLQLSSLNCMLFVAWWEEFPKIENHRVKFIELVILECRISVLNCLR